MTNPIDILIVGAGMYVCGKGTDGYGTVLPAVFEACRQGLVRTVHLVAATAESLRLAREKADGLSGILGIRPAMRFHPESPGQGPDALDLALNALAKPGCAVVCVPDHLHFSISRRLLEDHVHTLVVKPLVPRLDELRELIELQERSGVLGMVEFHKRFDEANITIRDLVGSGRLGDLLNIRVTYSQRKIVPEKHFRSWVSSTDIFQYLGIHYIDLVGFITGAVPRRVMSYGLKKWLVKQGIDTYDTLQTDVEWEMEDSGGRFLSSHLTGWVDPDTTGAMSDQRIEIIGTRGRIRSDQKDRGMTLVTDEAAGEEKINPYFSRISTSIRENRKQAKGYGPDSVISFIRDVSEIVNTGRPMSDFQGLRPTFASSLYPTAVLEASRKSLSLDNAWISIKDLL
jgi:predicted dehydrogenase